MIGWRCKFPLFTAITDAKLLWMRCSAQIYSSWLHLVLFMSVKLKAVPIMLHPGECPQHCPLGVSPLLTLQVPDLQPELMLISLLRRHFMAKWVMPNCSFWNFTTWSWRASCAQWCLQGKASGNNLKNKRREPSPKVPEPRDSTISPNGDFPPGTNPQLNLNCSSWVVNIQTLSNGSQFFMEVKVAVENPLVKTAKFTDPLGDGWLSSWTWEFSSAWMSLFFTTDNTKAERSAPRSSSHSQIFVGRSEGFCDRSGTAVRAARDAPRVGGG